MAAKYAFGVLEILSETEPPQDKRRVDDVAGIVDLAAIEKTDILVVATVFYNPSQRV